MSQNHYQLLGVAATATTQEIKLAYKRLAIQFHPDKHGGSTQFEEQFKAISAAYRVLSDPARRASYDHQLRAAVLRAEEARRQQQFRAQGQHVYGVPMPPPQPLRTRRPADSSERHYRTIPKRRPRFTRRDYLLTAGLFLLLLLFVVSVKVTMDHVTAVSNYENGLRAYAERKWSTAHGFFSEAIEFKPSYTQALRRRAEIEQLIYQNYKAARADYEVALQQDNTPQNTALLLYRLGQCQTNLAQKESAQRNLNQALALDSTLSGAWLARGELRLFDLLQFQAAADDFSVGMRQRAATGKKPALKYLTYRGLAFYKLRDFGAARQDYREVLLQNPKNGQVHFLLGRLAQQEGNTVAACEFFRRAIQLGYLYAGEALGQQCP
ncbi:DnaJ domain-containing protein [Hymenobacter sp. BT635]|uniref:DnaJ domain-containing protein n=1 Tax=Hymenobacter nitidus TaxID=2880929 RepID=A0ABS8AJW2_9BACT|nr:J domain-containing protein [Hymenobacter nitidus]MCB2380181.1 DnaJ domain-containing protein [Hymenobacter nitidus]